MSERMALAPMIPESVNRSPLLKSPDDDVLGRRVNSDSVLVSPLTAEHVGALKEGSIEHRPATPLSPPCFDKDLIKQSTEVMVPGRAPVSGLDRGVTPTEERKGSGMTPTEERKGSGVTPTEEKARRRLVQLPEPADLPGVAPPGEPVSPKVPEPVRQGSGRIRVARDSKDSLHTATAPAQSPVAEMEEDEDAGSRRGGPAKEKKQQRTKSLFGKMKMKMKAMKSIVDIEDIEEEEEEEDEKGGAEKKGIDALQQTRRLIAKAMTGFQRMMPDAKWRRYWDMLQLLGIFFHGLFVPLYLIDSISFARLAPTHVAASVLWVASAFVRLDTAYTRMDGSLETDRQVIFTRYMTEFFWNDACSAPPYDALFYWFGAHSIVVKIMASARLLRLWQVTKLFERSNPMIMTPQYVTFHFTMAPVLVSLFWAILSLHVLVVAKLALAVEGQEKDVRYDYALFWVWNLLTTSPAPLTLYSYEQQVLCFFLMIMGVFFQGVVIGRVSYELLKRTIEEENIEALRHTLSVVQQYNVPREIQQEVLSLQWHNLQSSLSAINRSDILQTLPSVLRNQIVLYMKIDFIDRVPMFQKAQQHTKVLLADSLEQEYFEPMQDIIRAGDIGSEMYFILHGYCDVLVPGVGSVGKLNKGQCFGEVALLTADRRTATIRALTYCDCLRLDKMDFDEVCAANPEFQEEIMQEAEKRLAGKKPSSTPTPQPTPPAVLIDEEPVVPGLTSIVRIVAEERAMEESLMRPLSNARLRLQGMISDVNQAYGNSDGQLPPVLQGQDPFNDISRQDSIREESMGEHKSDPSPQLKTSSPELRIRSPTHMPLGGGLGTFFQRTRGGNIGFGTSAHKYAPGRQIGKPPPIKVEDAAEVDPSAPQPLQRLTSPVWSQVAVQKMMRSQQGAVQCACGVVSNGSRFCTRCGRLLHGRCTCGSSDLNQDGVCRRCGRNCSAADAPTQHLQAPRPRDSAVDPQSRTYSGPPGDEIVSPSCRRLNTVPTNQLHMPFMQSEMIADEGPTRKKSGDDGAITARSLSSPSPETGARPPVPVPADFSSGDLPGSYHSPGLFPLPPACRERETSSPDRKSPTSRPRRGHSGQSDEGHDRMKRMEDNIIGEIHRVMHNQSELARSMETMRQDQQSLVVKMTEMQAYLLDLDPRVSRSRNTSLVGGSNPRGRRPTLENAVPSPSHHRTSAFGAFGAGVGGGVAGGFNGFGAPRMSSFRQQRESLFPTHSRPSMAG
eukprot:Hpha_TRINITY_DN15918_c1_g7::TRINITY_DN15918_c1_g7_i1::g.72163::m.72163